MNKPIELWSTKDMEGRPDLQARWEAWWWCRCTDQPLSTVDIQADHDTQLDEGFTFEHGNLRA